jgi:hypothetical protein
VSQADDDGDDDRARDFRRYKTYLERYRKQRKVTDRSDDISCQLTAKFHDPPQILHASAENYLRWIKKDKIGFDGQPALTAEMTGIPKIRQILYSLPADKNLKDYTKHITVAVPVLIEKTKRAVSDFSRDAGFRHIADDFDQLCAAALRDQHSQANAVFQNLSNDSIHRIRSDADAYRTQIDRRVEIWCSSLRGTTFTAAAWSRASRTPSSTQLLQLPPHSGQTQPRRAADT